MDVFLSFEETEQSKIFPNEAFGYWKIAVERPLRRRVDLSDATRARFRRTCSVTPYVLRARDLVAGLSKRIRAMGHAKAAVE